MPGHGQALSHLPVTFCVAILPWTAITTLLKENAVRRRTFLTTLPLAAAGSVSSARATTNGYGEEVSQEELVKYQKEGEECFVRPDVHAGDRPSGASFASRSPALGCSGAAGTAHPLATMTAIEMLKRGGSAVDAAVAANACLGFLEPTSSGLGGDCYAMLWDPKQAKVVGMASSGKIAEGALPGDRAGTRERRRVAKIRCD